MNIQIDDGVKIMDNKDVSYLDKLLLEKGILRAVPAAILRDIPQDDLGIWAVRNAVYQFITIEMIEWLKNELQEYNAIEICAGYGTIGRLLGIPATDFKLQDDPAIAAHYKSNGQARIPYPPDVIKMEAMEAMEAVQHFNADAVVAAFVTQYGTEQTHFKGIPCFPYGPKETQLLKLIKKYIVFGNEITHAKKWIYAKPHKKLQFDWIFSRALRPDLNRVWIFES